MAFAGPDERQPRYKWTIVLPKERRAKGRLRGVMRALEVGRFNYIQSRIGGRASSRSSLRTKKQSRRKDNGEGLRGCDEARPTEERQ